MPNVFKTTLKLYQFCWLSLKYMYCSNFDEYKASVEQSNLLHVALQQYMNRLKCYVQTRDWLIGV